jgi:hypothetical protein
MNINLEYSYFVGWCPSSPTNFAWHYYDEEDHEICTCDSCPPATPRRNPQAGPRPGTGWLDGIGTVRACIDCGVLVAGGPTRCVTCTYNRVPVEDDEEATP